MDQHVISLSDSLFSSQFRPLSMFLLMGLHNFWGQFVDSLFPLIGYLCYKLCICVLNPANSAICGVLGSMNSRCPHSENIALALVHLFGYC